MISITAIESSPTPNKWCRQFVDVRRGFPLTRFSEESTFSKYFSIPNTDKRRRIVVAGEEEAFAIRHPCTFNADNKSTKPGRGASNSDLTSSW